MFFDTGLNPKEYNIMEWKQFKDKYNSLIEDFNSLEFDERKKISLHSQCDVIAELIRTRNILIKSLKELDLRIITLSKILDKELSKRNNKSLNSTERF